MKTDVVKRKMTALGLMVFVTVMFVQAQWLRTAPNVYLQNSTDKVGIGTNAADPNDANSKLIILGNASVWGVKWSANGDEAKINFGAGGHYIRGLFGTGVQISACGLTTPAITIRDRCTGSAYDGNVGIGTVTPTAQLEVATSFKANGSSTFSGLIDINGGKNATWPWNNNTSGVTPPALTMLGPIGITHGIGKEDMGLAFSKGTCSSYQSAKYYNWIGQGVKYYYNTSAQNTSFCSLGLMDWAYGSSSVQYNGPSLVYSASGNRLFYIDANGLVSIVPPSPSYPALNVQGHAKVNGTISCKEIIVSQTPVFPDYVFDKKYKNQSLYDIERFVTKEKHLPDVPSAEDVKQKGLNVGDMQVVLLKKIEELTLHMIEIKKENDKFKEQIAELKSEIKPQIK